MLSNKNIAYIMTDTYYICFNTATYNIAEQCADLLPQRIYVTHHLYRMFIELHTSPSTDDCCGGAGFLLKNLPNDIVTFLALSASCTKLENNVCSHPEDGVDRFCILLSKEEYDLLCQARLDCLRR